MPVAQKTTRKKKSSSGRKPTTIMVGARPASKPKTRKPSARSTGLSGDPAPRKRKSGKDHATLPSWKQLESKKNRRRRQDSGSPFFGAISTARFALLLAGVATAFTLYVGHVHATQDLLARTEEARRENHRLHMKYNRLKGEYDRITGPAEIHRRAKAMGFVEDAAYGKTIIVER